MGRKIKMRENAAENKKEKEKTNDSRTVKRNHFPDDTGRKSIYVLR